VSGCPGPSNIEGVAFTNGEKFNFDSLSALGVDGVNYRLALTDRGGTTTTYPSHYDSRAMAFIGNVGLSYQQNMLINCLGIIFPLTEEMLSLHSPVPKESFNFAAAVKVELEWLVQHKILTTNGTEIDSIIKKLEISNNGGVQFWTMQKNTLGYNSWYTYDTINGTWNGTGVNAVRSEKSESGVNGCSGVEIPHLEILIPVPVKENKQLSENNTNTYLNVSGRTIKVQGLQIDRRVDIRVVSITGKVMQSFSMKGNSDYRVELNNLAPGTYLIRCTIAGLNLSKSIVVY
jgi:hypothetical protein